MDLDSLPRHPVHRVIYEVREIPASSIIRLGHSPRLLVDKYGESADIGHMGHGTAVSGLVITWKVLEYAYNSVIIC